LHVPHHRVRDTVLEALPCWRANAYVIGVVNAPVGPRKNLLRVIRVNNNRINRNIREIAGLVEPSVRSAVGSAGHLKHVARG
jgi:demethoxyubiquinone hydroxylase (CLK1/Coq7/Cat5 family)